MCSKHKSAWCANSVRALEAAHFCTGEDVAEKLDTDFGEKFHLKRIFILQHSLLLKTLYVLDNYYCKLHPRHFWIKFTLLVAA